MPVHSLQVFNIPDKENGHPGSDFVEVGPLTDCDFSVAMKNIHEGDETLVYLEVYDEGNKCIP